MISIKHKDPVSVVITTYERSPAYELDNFLLKRAVMSVIDQTHPVSEIVIVIDGESKYVPKIVSQFQKRMSIRAIYTHHKVGGSEARNIGICAVRNEIVALLDDDDEWLPSKIDTQLQLFNRVHNKKNVVIFSPMYLGEDTGMISQRQRYVSGTNIIDYVLGQMGSVQTSTLLFDKNVFLSHPFTKDLPKYQDWDWVFQLYLYHSVLFYQNRDPLTFYHVDAKKTISVGRRYTPIFSLQWIEQYKNHATLDAYHQFLWSNVLSPVFHNQTTFKQKKIVLQKLSFLDFFATIFFRFKSFLSIK